MAVLRYFLGIRFGPPTEEYFASSQHTQHMLAVDTEIDRKDNVLIIAKWLELGSCHIVEPQACYATRGVAYSQRLELLLSRVMLGRGVAYSQRLELLLSRVMLGRGVAYSQRLELLLSRVMLGRRAAYSQRLELLLSRVMLGRGVAYSQRLELLLTRVMLGRGVAYSQRLELLLSRVMWDQRSHKTNRWSSGVAR
ncbi:hypothetical protein J6590_051777 [Homalodisca vitripennis]|nr:hypothetical protein J6590_051777 [Homalodisca vitripennis]